jgi:two-component system, chemotaxis family, protein-glutamate methylesterase/glutaminase
MAQNKMNNNRLIVIGGSSGSLQVVLHILSHLPKHFSVPVLLIIHRGNSSESSLLDLLILRSVLPVREVEEKEKIIVGRVYLAPADFHVLIEKDKTFSLDYSEKLNFSRPSIDISFISSAAVYGSGLTGILLSGANEDGAEGLRQIKGYGGYTIIQDPEDALVNYMPKQASLKSQIDEILDTPGITNYLLSLAGTADE